MTPSPRPPARTADELCDVCNGTGKVGDRHSVARDYDAPLCTVCGGTGMTPPARVAPADEGQQQPQDQLQSGSTMKNQPQVQWLTRDASVRERPIPFSAPMVRALLDGTKTQTRRVVKGEWARSLDACSVPTKLVQLPARLLQASCDCLYGQPGDRLWVRETCLRLKADIGSRSGNPEWDEIMYADHEDYDICWPVKGEAVDLGWRVVPSIFMPRWASRITLELTGVRVERVQDISILDAHAEGVDEWGHGLPTERERDEQRNRTAVENYARLWDSLNAKRGYGWDANPWVWVLTFRAATDSPHGAPVPELTSGAAATSRSIPQDVAAQALTPETFHV